MRIVNNNKLVKIVKSIQKRNQTMRSVNDHNKAIRKDNKLVKRVKEIEIEISEVCQKLSSELGVDIGWSDAIEIAHGMPLKQLWKMMR